MYAVMVPDAHQQDRKQDCSPAYRPCGQDIGLKHVMNHCCMPSGQDIGLKHVMNHCSMP